MRGLTRLTRERCGALPEARFPLRLVGFVAQSTCLVKSGSFYLPNLINLLFVVSEAEREAKGVEVTYCIKFNSYQVQKFYSLYARF